MVFFWYSQIQKLALYLPIQSALLVLWAAIMQLFLNPFVIIVNRLK